VIDQFVLLAFPLVSALDSNKGLAAKLEASLRAVVAAVLAQALSGNHVVFVALNHAS
jgi:hypothetical protein